VGNNCEGGERISRSSGGRGTGVQDMNGKEAIHADESDIQSSVGNSKRGGAIQKSGKGEGNSDGTNSREDEVMDGGTSKT
jgi:hypothetical protein